MAIDTILWRDGAVEIIDQRRLPGEFVKLRCETLPELWEAIRTLAVRGAPALGGAGALGMRLAAERSSAGSAGELVAELAKAASYLGESRPTAVNLFWAIDEVLRRARESADSVNAIMKAVRLASQEILDDDIERCRKIGEHGAELLPDEATVLTHCNAGSLATVGDGTALSVIYAAIKSGKRVRVYADETRPLLQGARLTAWELSESEVDVTVLCDSAAATVLRRGLVDCCVVGADRIARNGDVANKVGTYPLSLAAKANGVPFYVAAPLSTFDLELQNGDGIPIEERSAEEVLEPLGVRAAPKGVKAFNPAFDVTPAENVTAIITELGVVRAPYRESIGALLD